MAVLESFEDGLKQGINAAIDNGGGLLRPRPDLLHVVEPEGDTLISAVPVPLGTQQVSEWRPVCMITVTALLKERPRLTDEQINACNRYAGLSLLTRQNDQPHVMAVNAFTIYDDAAQRQQSLYFALQAAVLQRTWLSQVLAGLEDDFRRAIEVVDPESASKPSAWTIDEVAGMFRIVTSTDHPARQNDPNGFVIHLSKQPKVRGQGSFVVVRNDVAHPFYGNGLSVTLVLPEEQGLSKEQIDARALAWNRREALSIMPTPCIGAWSSRPGRSQMQHQTFLPNVIYAAGIGQVVIDTAVERWAVSGDDPGTSL